MKANNRETKKTDYPRLQAIRSPLFSSADGDPYALTLRSLGEAALQEGHIAAAVEHLAYLAVFAYEDASLGVARGVASVDADALSPP